MRSTLTPKYGSSSPKKVARRRRHLRVRKNLSGTAARPRLVLNRSSRHVYAQLVDDLTGTTLASASSMEADVRALTGDKKEKASQVGKLLGERAKAVGIEQVVFDRSGYKYHGRVAALADGARDAGLEF